MKEIVKELEVISAKIAETETKFPKDGRPDSVTNLIMRWHEYQRGIIRACRLLGVRPEATDLKGLKWTLVLDD